MTILLPSETVGISEAFVKPDGEAPDALGAILGRKVNRDEVYSKNEVDDLVQTTNDLVDSSVYIVNEADGTKRVRFQVSGVATGTTRTWAFPNESDTFVGLTIPQTILNKTFGVTIFEGNILLQPAGDARLEIGRVDGVASTPAIDFHSGETPTNYDARISATGSTGLNAGASINVQSTGFTWNGAQIAVASKPLATVGVPSFLAEDGSGNVVRSPNRLFQTRAELAAAKIQLGVTTVTVERYAAGGPVVNMVYSINDTTQVSVDPTSMAVTTVAANGTTSTKYTKLISPRVTPAMMAAPINGTGDDAVAITRALTYFKNCYPDAVGPAWVDYIIKSVVTVPSNSLTDFKASRGWWLVDLQTTFTNADSGTDSYGNTTVPIQIYGSRSGTDIPKVDVQFLGVRIKPITQVLQRYNKVIAAFNVSDLVIRNCEITGFSAGDMISLNSCVGGRQEICDNTIHDLLVNTTFPSGVNSTEMGGIIVDSDRVHNAKSSLRMTISGNRIYNFVTGPIPLAAYSSQQSDAISLNAASVDTFHLVTNNQAYNVGNGMGCFSSRNTISDNHFNDITDGLHFDHGFSNNLVSGNHLTNCKRLGIGIAGRDGADSINNLCVSNKIHVVGGAAFSATFEAVALEESGTGVCAGNVFRDNEYDVPGGVTVFYNQCISGRNRSVGDTFLSFGSDARSCVLATATDKTLLQIEKPVNGTNVRVRPTTSYTHIGATLTSVKIPFATIVADSRGEWDAANTRVNLVMPGWYTFRLSLFITNYRTGTKYLFEVKSTSPDGGTVSHIFATDRVTSTDIDNKVVQFSGRAFVNYGAQVTAWVQHFTAVGDLIFDGAESYMEVIKE